MSAGTSAPEIIHMGCCAALVYRACHVCKKSWLSLPQVVGDHLVHHLGLASCMSAMLKSSCVPVQQVAGDLDLEMHGPHLESLRLSYGQATCRAPAKLPQLRCLYQETPSLRASDLHNCRNLERVELGTFCKVTPVATCESFLARIPLSEVDTAIPHHSCRPCAQKAGH